MVRQIHESVIRLGPEEQLTALVALDRRRRRLRDYERRVVEQRQRKAAAVALEPRVSLEDFQFRLSLLRCFFHRSTELDMVARH